MDGIKTLLCSIALPPRQLHFYTPTTKKTLQNSITKVVYHGGDFERIFLFTSAAQHLLCDYALEEKSREIPDKNIV